ncbi:MAG: ABC transporter substrate-binding protein [Flavobacteriales bacterium]|nr:ABC transporter substrate-binding protein [Flavobacteriales bacterium]
MDPIVLRIAGVPEHFNLPWLLALERRAYVRAGIDLKWTTIPQGTGRMRDLMCNGEVDLAVMVTEGAVRGIIHGDPYRIVAQYVDTPLTWGMHMGTASKLESADQLAEVPIAVSRLNSGSHLAALAYARSKGWARNENGIEVVNDLPGAVERLKAPEAAVFFWEKYTTKHLVDDGTFRCLDEHRSTWPAFVIVASEAILAEHPKEVGRLLKVIRDQAAGLMQKKTAPEIIAQRYKLSVADAKAWFNGVKWNTGGPVDLEAMKRVVADLEPPPHPLPSVLSRPVMNAWTHARMTTCPHALHRTPIRRHRRRLHHW